MSIPLATSFYTARLRVTPSPATLSETFAILLELKQLGSVVTFAQDDIIPKSTVTDSGQANVETKSYSIVYTSLAPRLQALQSGSTKDAVRKSITFDVSANANLPNPRDLDPYNVRGLLERKPRPKPQKFSCTLTIGEHKPTHPPMESSIITKYRAPFSVDRDSAFAWALAKTDAPTGLIAGLLPKTNKNPKELGTRKGATPHTFTSRQIITRARNAPIESASSKDTPLAAFSLSKMYRKVTGEVQPYAKKFRQFKI